MTLSVRPVRAEDADALYPLLDGTAVTDTLLWDGPASLADYRASLGERAERVARGELHVFAICADGRPVGCCDVRPDGFRGGLGLWIGAPYQGRGLGAGAVAWMVAYAFGTLELAKLEAKVFVGNEASRRVFEKCGFALEGTIRRAVVKRGRFVDEWLFGILPDSR